MIDDRLDLSLAATEPLGSDDDLTDDIPSRPRLLLPFWVYAHARIRVERGEFRSVSDLFQVAIAAYLAHLAAEDECDRGLTDADKALRALGVTSSSAAAYPEVPARRGEDEEDAPPFPADSDRSPAEDSAAREALESWVDELLETIEANPAAVSQATPGQRRPQ